MKTKIKPWGMTPKKPVVSNKEFYIHVSKLLKEGTNRNMMNHCALGIAGESGELADCIKKYIYYGQPLDEENYLEELGDILFYVVGALGVRGLEIEDAMEYNISKLEARYPEGKFTVDHAKKRLDK